MNKKHTRRREQVLKVIKTLDPDFRFNSGSLASIMSERYQRAPTSRECARILEDLARTNQVVRYPREIGSATDYRRNC